MERLDEIEASEPWAPTPLVSKASKNQTGDAVIFRRPLSALATNSLGPAAAGVGPAALKPPRAAAPAPRGARYRDP